MRVQTVHIHLTVRQASQVNRANLVNQVLKIIKKKWIGKFSFNLNRRENKRGNDTQLKKYPSKDSKRKSYKRDVVKHRKYRKSRKSRSRSRSRKRFHRSRSRNRDKKREVKNEKKNDNKIKDTSTKSNKNEQDIANIPVIKKEEPKKVVKGRGSIRKDESHALLGWEEEDYHKSNKKLIDSGYRFKDNFYSKRNNIVEVSISF